MARTGTGARLPFYTIALVMAGLMVMAVLAFGIGVASRADAQDGGAVGKLGPPNTRITPTPYPTNVPSCNPHDANSCNIPPPRRLRILRMFRVVVPIILIRVTHQPPRRLRILRMFRVVIPMMLIRVTYHPPRLSRRRRLLRLSRRRIHQHQLRQHRRQHPCPRRLP